LTRFFCLSLTLLLMPAAAQARVWEVGPGRDLALPSTAALVVKDGDTVVIDAGTYGDCAIWRANNLLIEGKGAVVLRGRVCDDKAIFVTLGDNITVRGLAFVHARSINRNGAGIRGVGANLTVEASRFTDNEDGILTGENPASHIVIKDSLFEGNGVCDPVCAHGIYVGRIAALSVLHSRFAGQKQGHHIKSRALSTEVIGDDIADGPDGTASFAVDIPDGGRLVVSDCVIEKGPKSENRMAAISLGEESNANPTAEIRIEHNLYVNDGGGPVAFVRNLTPARVTFNDNKIKGPGDWLWKTAKPSP
jgi:hypothetical protein